MCVAPARFRLLAHANMPVAILAHALQERAVAPREQVLALQTQLTAEPQAWAAMRRVRRFAGEHRPPKSQRQA
jgi:hypothetical protein